MSQTIIQPSRPRIRVTTNTAADEIQVDAKINDYDRIKQEIAQKLGKSAPKEIAEQLADLQTEFIKTGQTMEITPPDTERTPINKTAPLAAPAPVPSNITDSPPAQPRVSQSFSSELGPHARREGLPSCGVFYKFDDVTIRPFSVPDFAKLHIGQSQNRADIIIDTLGETLSVDVWDLTRKDFDFLMYWQRINSFVRNPYRLSWTSFYGNQNILTISKSNLQINTLTTTPEAYQAWVQRGFVMPSMRDLNEYDNLRESLSADDLFYWTRAKYIQGANVKQKIEHARALDADTFFVDVKDFATVFEDYGVVESVETKDQHFDATTAVAKLQEFISNSELMLQDRALTVELSNQLLTSMAAAKDEIARINQQLANTGEAEPRLETVAFQINVTDFFSLL